VGIVDSWIGLETSSLTSSIALFSTNARMANWFGEINFLGFLSFDCGDNDEDDRFLFADLGMLGDDF